MTVEREREAPAAAGAAQVHSVREVFARLLATAEGETVSVGQIIDAFGARAYGPLLFVIGLVIISPLSAIPGAMIVSAIIVIALTIQSLLRTGSPWIPGRIRRIEIRAARMRRALERVVPWFERLERVVRPRLVPLLRPPVGRVWHVCCILISLTLIPLTFVPFAVTVPGLSLALIGLGLMSGDGVLVLAGIAVSAGAFWLGAAAISAAL